MSIDIADDLLLCDSAIPRDTKAHLRLRIAVAAQ